MNAEIINLDAWKQSHPPALICLQHGMTCALAWQELWFKTALAFCGQPYVS